MIFKNEKTEWLILRAERYSQVYGYVYLVHLTDEFLEHIRTFHRFMHLNPDVREGIMLDIGNYDFTLVCVEDCEVPELKEWLSKEIEFSFIELTEEDLDSMVEVSIDYYADDYFYVQDGHLYARMYHLYNDDTEFRKYEAKPFPIEKLL